MVEGKAVITVIFYLFATFGISLAIRDDHKHTKAYLILLLAITIYFFKILSDVN